MSQGELDPREESVRRAFLAHAQEVVSLLARLLRDPEQARDLCQETFVRYHDRRDEVEREPGPWLRSVAFRLALDALRRRRLERESLPRLVPGAAAADLDPLEARERRDRVSEALSRLPERQRSVVFLRVLDGETFPEVARALGISEGAAKVHLRRALESLRASLGPFMKHESPEEKEGASP
ncbi:sigma-70 family RNA polymerase sigma factor [bacterium]|nr:sigma-70 family RNA polymerase sigma factor [bacterium]